MKIAINQPAFMPWPGYLDRIARVDQFVIMDAVQFERGSFINRNRIKTQHGARWLTVPVKLKGHMNSRICDTRIDNSKLWAQNHAKQILYAYHRAPRFGENAPFLEGLYAKDQGTISDLCVNWLVDFWMVQYGIETPICLMPRAFRYPGKTEQIIEICQSFEADEYLAGPLSRGYLELDKMEKAGIAVEFHDYIPPVYPQLWGEFIPGLSILDMWMNTELNPWLPSSLSQPTQMMKHWDAAEP